MSIITTEPPVRKSHGRQPRLSEEDIKDLATALKGGNWAGEDEPAPSKSAAYQRAKGAIKQLSANYKLEDLLGKGQVFTTAAVPVDDPDPKKPHNWRIGSKSKPKDKPATS